MKKKFSRILGVALTLALLSSLTMVAAPVSAGIGDDDNTWGAVGMPAIAPETEVGVMAIAPDGTMFVAVFYEAGYSAAQTPVIDPSIDGTWDIMMSTDGGFKWTATELTGLVDNDGDISTWDTGGRDQTPVDIVISPNWGYDETLYVACLNGDIFRLEGAGAAIPILLKEIVDSYGDTLDSYDGFLYDIDVWYDGSDNWIMAACDMDVLVLRDNPWFEDWRDQELATGGSWGYAVQANFAPDFNSSSLIWAVAGDPWLYLTSTISPGQWGNTIKPVMFDSQTSGNNWWSPYVDIAFPGNYSSTTPLLYVAIAEDDFEDEGNLYMVQGALVASTALTEADPLLPDDLDVGSVEVSGNVILVVDTWNGDVWVSYNAGDTFDLAVRGPSGPFSFWGHVYMAPGAFDPDEGVAYFTSIDYGFGDSALSRTDDGGVTWDQISWVDTYIDWILDVAFAPEGASQPALLLTNDYGSWTDSLWQTADATATSPQWVRVATNDNLGVNFLEQVEYALDGSAIMLFVDDGDWAIYKSTDDANTFTHWRDLPAPVGYLNDWVVANSATIYTACTGGYYGTSVFGPATLELLGNLNSIAVDGDTIIVGNNNAYIYVSTDTGENWGDAQDVIAISQGDIYVAFDADFAVGGADGEGLIYFTGSGSNTSVGVAEVDGNELDDIDYLLDDTEDNDAYDPDGYTGIVVSRDGGERNALYAMESDGELVRLLLHEDLNLWEEASDTALTSPDGLWFTNGSNIVWTINGDEIWALEDTLAGPITGLDVTFVDEDEADVEWNAMTGAGDYEVEWWNSFNYYDFTDDTEYTIEDLVDNDQYDVRVRAATQDVDSPWSSRWSTEVDFITLESIYAPYNLVPYNGMQDAPLLPSFVWEHYLWSWVEIGEESFFISFESNAEYYELQLSTSPVYTEAGFATVVERAIIDAPTIAYTCETVLAYDTNHYWIVRAVSTDSLSGEDAISDWCFSNFHTMLEPIPPVTVEPAPTPTIILPTPTVTVVPPDVSVTVVPPDITVDIPQPTTIITTVEPVIVLPEDVAPAYIWVIVAIGAMLVIAVIILIIRTRRVV